MTVKQLFVDTGVERPCIYTIVPWSSIVLPVSDVLMKIQVVVERDGQLVVEEIEVPDYVPRVQIVDLSSSEEFKTAWDTLPMILEEKPETWRDRPPLL